VVRSGLQLGSRGILTTLVVALVCSLPIPAGAVSAGDRAPDFSLLDQTGAARSLSSEAGKVRLLYFFGHSAPVCAETARQIETDLQVAYGPKGLVVFGLECWDGTAQQIRDFVSANAVTFPILGNAGDTARLYDVPYESIVVIDTGGVVRLVLQGPDASAYDQKRIEQTIKSLLQDPSYTDMQTWGAIKALFSR
jgi:peroxiredoxin